MLKSNSAPLTGNLLFQLFLQEEALKGISDHWIKDKQIYVLVAELGAKLASACFLFFFFSVR